MWKNVIGYEDAFEISNTGELRNKKTNRILKQHTRTSGYQQAAIKLGGRKGINICFKIHRLVAEAFIPNPYNLPEVNHIDGNKANNTAINLEWVSRQSNMKHAVDTGLIVPRARVYLRKLDRIDADRIRKVYIKGHKHFGMRALAREYAVDHSVIRKILINETYIL